MLGKLCMHYFNHLKQCYQCLTECYLVIWSEKVYVRQHTKRYPADTNYSIYSIILNNWYDYK